MPPDSNHPKKISLKEKVNEVLAQVTDPRQHLLNHHDPRQPLEDYNRLHHVRERAAGDKLSRGVKDMAALISSKAVVLSFGKSSRVKKYHMPCSILCWKKGILSF
ncbi:hypothetical protein D3C81_1721780 [compost metagenome]